MFNAGLDNLSFPFPRFAQPLHREFNIIALDVGPALDLSLIAVFREALKIFPRNLPGSLYFAGEFLWNIWIAGHGDIIPTIRHRGKPHERWARPPLNQESGDTDGPAYTVAVHEAKFAKIQPCPSSESELACGPVRSAS